MTSAGRRENRVIKIIKENKAASGAMALAASALACLGMYVGADFLLDSRDVDPDSSSISLSEEELVRILAEQRDHLVTQLAQQQNSQATQAAERDDRYATQAADQDSRYATQFASQATEIIDELNNTLQAPTYEPTLTSTSTSTATRETTEEPTEESSPTPINTPTPKVASTPNVHEYVGVPENKDESIVLSNGPIFAHDGIDVWLNHMKEGIDDYGDPFRHQVPLTGPFESPWFDGHQGDVVFGLLSEAAQSTKLQERGLKIIESADPDALEAGNQIVRGHIKKVVVDGEAVSSIDLSQENFDDVFDKAEITRQDGTTYEQIMAVTYADNLEEAQEHVLFELATIINQLNKQTNPEAEGQVTFDLEDLNLAAEVLQINNDNLWTGENQRPVRVYLNDETVIELDSAEIDVQSPNWRTCRIESGPAIDGDRTKQDERLNEVEIVSADGKEISFEEIDAQSGHVVAVVADWSELSNAWNNATSFSEKLKALVDNLRIEFVNDATNSMTDIPAEYEVSPEMNQALGELVYRALMYKVCGFAPPIVKQEAVEQPPQEAPIIIIEPTQGETFPTAPFTHTPPSATPQQPPTSQPPTQTVEPTQIKDPVGDQVNLDGETESPPTGGEEIIDGEIDLDGDGVGDVEDNIGSGR